MDAPAPRAGPAGLRSKARAAPAQRAGLVGAGRAPEAVPGHRGLTGAHARCRARPGAAAPEASHPQWSTQGLRQRHRPSAETLARDQLPAPPRGLLPLPGCGCSSGKTCLLAAALRGTMMAASKVEG